MKKFLYLPLDSYIYMNVKTHMSRWLSVTFFNSFGKTYKSNNFNKNFGLLDRGNKAVSGFWAQCHGVPQAFWQMSWNSLTELNFYYI